MKEGNILPPTNSPGRGRGEERGKCTTRGTGRGWADVVSGNLYGPRRDVVLDAPQICLNLCGHAKGSPQKKGSGLPPMSTTKCLPPNSTPRNGHFRDSAAGPSRLHGGWRQFIDC